MAQWLNRDHVARNIRTAREHRGFSVNQLADKLGVDRTTIFNWESGRTMPLPESMKALREVLEVADFDVPPEEFAAVNGIKHNDPYIEILPGAPADFDRRILELAQAATKVVRYSRLCDAFASNRGLRPLELSDAAFRARLKKGEITFQRIEVFFDKASILNAMQDTLDLAGVRYQCHYFATPATDMPAINLRIYDDRVFVFGGFRDRAGKSGDERALYLQDREPLASMLQDYWNELWNRSELFPRPDQWAQFAYADFRLGEREWRTLQKRARGWAALQTTAGAGRRI